MRKAAFPAMKSFESFDFTGVKLPEGHNTTDMRSLEWVEAAQDYVFYGQTGRGKTHLVIALGILGVNAGKAVRCFPCAQLVLMLQKAQEDGRLDAVYADMAKADLVILDEFGYIPLDSRGLICEVSRTAAFHLGLLGAFSWTNSTTSWGEGAHGGVLMGLGTHRSGDLQIGSRPS